MARAMRLRSLLALALLSPLAGCIAPADAAPRAAPPEAPPAPFYDSDFWSTAKAGPSVSTWRNPLGGALISVSAYLDAGAVLVRVVDNNGKEVWSETLTGPGTDMRSTTARGVSGTWTFERVSVGAARGVVSISAYAE